MRLIDADALLADIHNAMCADCEDECAACQWRDAIRLIESAPTVKPKRESRAMLPCKCGSKLREHWYAPDAEKSEILKCMRCGFKVSGKNEMDVIREWNRAIRIEQTARQTEEGETLCD